ncbi:MAG TPA: PxKF domain-containing protein [Anaerolineales bacterium]|nr:PxKF domain-containing protein [Anaerolineales bacterium]
MKTKFFNALSLALIAAMLVTSLALADNVLNTVVAGGNDTITVGGSTTIDYRIQQTGAGNDGQSGCNAEDGSSATLTINTPAGVTATPGSLTFSACGVAAAQSVTFTAAAAGNYPITVSVADAGTGTYDTGQAAFTLHVNAPPPPSDTTAPVISYVLNPASPDGNNGWYKSNVTLTWSVSEPESAGSLVKTGCVDQNITSDQAATTYSCSATSDGGSAAQVDVTIKRDATAPTISGSASPTPNGAGWNNTNVDVTFTCNDNLSGIASCGPDDTLSSEGAGQSVSGTAVDNAGNSAGSTVSGINIDKTAPSVSLVGGPADGGSYYFGSVPAAPTCSASDALSGLAGACSVSGYGTTVGSHTVIASASDNAGNSASASATYTVLAWTLNGFYAPVDMSGVYNLVKGGSTVPLKFEVFAGLTELTSTSVVLSFVQTRIACDGSSPMDEIEVVTTGGTSLRYDATAGQFIQNWQTPRLPGVCYRVTMTTLDGSFLQAFFKLK